VTAGEQATQLIDGLIPLSAASGLIVADSYAHPEIDVRGLPPYRNVQESNEELVLDEMGRYLTESGHSVGARTEIADRVTIINEGVGFLFRRLAHLVSTARAEQLLFALLGHHERVIAERSRQKLFLPARFVSESTAQTAEASFGEMLPQYTKTAICLRFLIEYTTACPPTGVRPVSVGYLDGLVAYAAEIFNWGTDSDLLRYQIADIGVAMLDSGRLGTKRRAWRDAQEAYLAATLDVEIAEARSESAEQNEAETPDRPVDLDEYDAAATAEWGASFSELASVTGEVMNLGWDQPNEPKWLPAADFKRELAVRLAWTAARVETVLDHWTLGARPNFLKPPDPFKTYDVYPWRYNRQLSYLRRPLLLWRRSDDVDYIVWGNRHIRDALQNLTTLCSSGRLQARSIAMQQLMGRRSHAAGRAFTSRVASDIARRPELIVRKEVKSIGSLRLERDSGQPLGDIDVLVADPISRRLWSIEVKNLAVARTPAELHNEIAEILKSSDGPKAATEIHTERTRWLQQHLRQALLWMGIDTVEGGRWSVHPLMVTQRDLFSAQVVRTRIPVLAYRHLVTILQHPKPGFRVP
jgi:hypothetical protein